MISGWLFDLYPLGNKMIFWIKHENSDTIRLEDSSWGHSIYVESDDNSCLNSIVDNSGFWDDNNISSLITDYEFTSRYERVTDITKSDVLKLKLADSTKALTLARKIEAIDDNREFGKYNYHQY